MSRPHDGDGLDPIGSVPEVEALFSPAARLQRMLDVEAALARAGARAGLIPEGAAEVIAEQCQVARFDVAAILREGAVAGTPVVPLVRALSELVGDEVSDAVHLGATSQDVIDTAMVLQIRDALGWFEDQLVALGERCSWLAHEHAATVMAGRTLLQQAQPVTFGLKAAGWLSSVTRHVERIRRLRSGLVIQFGGAVGTLASLGDRGVDVADLFAEELGLGVPDVPWHADRQLIAEVVSAVGIVAGSMAKIATDVVLLMQTEVGEVTEGAGPGRGSSSAMPHKRNPVDAPAAIAAARLAHGAVHVALGSMIQEHERGSSGWQTEWTMVPDALRCAAAAVAHTRSALGGLEVDAERMRANLEQGGGLAMSGALATALAPALGRRRAFAVVAELSSRAAKEGIDLRTAAGADDRVRAALVEHELDGVFDPGRALGSCQAFVRRAVEGFRSTVAGVSTEA